MSGDAVSVAPDIYTVVFENERVRVLEVVPVLVVDRPCIDIRTQSCTPLRRQTSLWCPPTAVNTMLKSRRAPPSGMMPLSTRFGTWVRLPFTSSE
jgi:hypothetical protein